MMRIRKLHEAPVSVENAKQSKLALHVINKGSSRFGNSALYILYDAATFIRYIKDNKSLITSIEDAMVGMIHVHAPEGRAAHGAKEVGTSAAKKGYGPLMYDIAMALSGGLISDRDAVSTSAKKVWNKYLQRSDVEKKPLDNIYDPDTPPKNDDARVWEEPAPDEKALNNAYFINDFPSVKALFNNDDECINIAIKHFEGDDYLLSEKEIEQAFDDASESFFQVRYDA